MSKPRPRSNVQSSSNPFAIPGMDFNNLGNLMNLDPKMIDSHLNSQGDDDIDDDELEKELMELESNRPRKIERRAPPKPNKKIQDLNAINLDRLLGDDADDADLDDVDENELERELAGLTPDEEEINDSKSTAVQHSKQNQNNVLAANKITGSDSKLKNLEQNFNLFNKKYNDAVNSNDSSKTKRFKRIVDQYNDAIKAYKSGKEFDYDMLPIAPELIDSTENTPANVPSPKKEAPIYVERNRVEETRKMESEASNKNLINENIPIKSSQNLMQKNEQSTGLNDKDEREIFQAPEPANTTLGALEQLKNEFQKKIKQAEESDDSSKKRRYERSLKQVEAAIKATKLNKPFDYNELTPIIPPGFGQIPLMNGLPVTQANASLANQAAIANNQQQALAKQKQQQQQAVAAKTTSPNPKMKQNEQNLKELRDRQRLFKEAAIEAKRKGDDKVAVLYLKNAKGFDNMIIAAENGLPLDMTNIPKPPQMMAKLHDNKRSIAASNKNEDEDDYEIVSSDDISGDRDDIFKRLEQDLRSQIKISNTNSQYFTNMGDVANATKFRNIEKESLKDLAGLQSALKHGDPIPKYHYEKRKYQMVNCCVDLTDNDCELTIIRCINLPIPSGIDAKNLQTYVKFEFPYPAETPPTEKSSKQTGNNPEFNQVFKLQIQRKQNKCLRLLNRKELKIEVFYKAGLLKGDKLLATANVKLQPLEEKCEIHEAVELFEGRKPTTGKIEVKLRVRDPLLHKEIKIIEEKWLIIDKFLASNHTKAANFSTSSSSGSNNNYFDGEKEIHSVEVLNFDRNLIEKQIETYKNRLSQPQLMELLEKSEHLNQLMNSIKDKLKNGGRPAFSVYLNNISTLPKKYDDLAKQCQIAGDENKLMLHAKRKQIVENEIVKIKSRLN